MSHNRDQTQAGELVHQASALIGQSQESASAQTNVTLTLRIRHIIQAPLLRQGHAGYDQELLAALAQQLSWSHSREMLPLINSRAGVFYAQEVTDFPLDVRNLRRAIECKNLERLEIAASQIPEGAAVPQDAFRDPVLLDKLGLAETYLERDLEAALRHDMESFSLDHGRNWECVECEKRLLVVYQDYFFYLLFYSLRLHGLVAVELKAGKLKLSYQGHVSFHLSGSTGTKGRWMRTDPLALSCAQRGVKTSSSCSHSRRTDSPSLNIGQHRGQKQKSSLTSRRFTEMRKNGLPVNNSTHRQRLTQKPSCQKKYMADSPATGGIRR